MLKTHFSGHSKIWGAIKFGGTLPPNIPVVTGLVVVHPVSSLSANV